MTYYGNDIYSSSLFHYGVLGMKWGVRRYQNYDGTYTQKGLERYRKASKAYDDAKLRAKQTKLNYKRGEATKSQYIESKADVKRTRRALDKSYSRLKKDKLADQGKELYRSGKTIGSGNVKLMMSQAAFSAGAVVARELIKGQTGNQNLANRSAAAITTGGLAVNGFLYLRNESRAKKLRAYYAH